MSPPRPLRLLLLLLGGGCLLVAAGRDKGAAGSATEPASGPAGGRFVSPERHACSWQLLPRAPGPAAGSELALRCRDPAGALQQCAYRGEPERCAAYAARGSHYWKQVLGGLRKKRRPCQDPAPLRARLCAGRKGHRAELRLVPHGSSSLRPTEAVFPRDPEAPARSRGPLQESAPGPTGGARLPASKSPRGKPSEKTKAAKRKAASDPEDERTPGTRPDPDGLDENANLTETYCAEKWHSLCNFFVSFWNG